MPAYRIYFLDQEGHVARPPQIIEADNDQQVSEVAKQFIGWSRHRGLAGSPPCNEIPAPIGPARHPPASRARTEGEEVTDDELHAWIVGLVERDMDGEDRKQALEWLEIRVASFDAMKQSGLIADEDLILMGLQPRK